MKALVITAILLMAAANRAKAGGVASGTASWYGEDHRGRLMSNGRRFDPDKLTGASWFYPLGAKLRLSVSSQAHSRSVVITITDRGPAKRLVRHGRIIDLSYAAFSQLAHPDLGLVAVIVEPLNQEIASDKSNLRAVAAVSDRVGAAPAAESSVAKSAALDHVSPVPIHGQFETLLDAPRGLIAEQTPALADVSHRMFDIPRPELAINRLLVRQ
jgi:rare lipoprotein A